MLNYLYIYVRFVSSLRLWKDNELWNYATIIPLLDTLELEAEDISLALDIFMQLKKKAVAHSKAAVRFLADSVSKYEVIATLCVMAVCFRDLRKVGLFLVAHYYNYVNYSKRVLFLIF